MFLTMLGPMQQEAFLFLTREFVAIDSTISPEEQDAYNRMAREMGFEKYPPRYIFSHEAAVEALTTRKAKAIVILELVNAAHVDGEYGEPEKEFVRGLAEEIGVPEATVNEIEDWAGRHVAMINEAKELWFNSP